MMFTWMLSVTIPFRYACYDISVTLRWARISTFFLPLVYMEKWGFQHCPPPRALSLFFFPYYFHVHPHRLKAIQNSGCSKTEFFLLWIIIQCSQTHSNQFCLPVKFIYIYFSARENSSVLFPLVWLFGLGFVCFFFFSLRGVSSEQMFYYSDWKIMKQVEFIPEMDFIPSYQHLI